MVGIDLQQIIKHSVFHVLDACLIIPQLLEPRPEIVSVTVVPNDEVQFDVVVIRREAEAPSGEIRATQNRSGNLSTPDVRHLP